MEFDKISEDEKEDNEVSEEETQIKEDFCKYMRNTEININSFLFINDRNHLFNKIKPKNKSRKYD